MVPVKKGQKAIATYDKVLSLVPANATALKGKGNALRLISGDGVEGVEQIRTLSLAIGCFDEALKYSPNDSSIYSNKGKALLRLSLLNTAMNENLQSKSNAGKALSSFKKAITLNHGIEPYCQKEVKDAESLASGRLPKELLRKMQFLEEQFEKEGILVRPLKKSIK